MAKAVFQLSSGERRSFCFGKRYKHTVLGVLGVCKNLLSKQSKKAYRYWATRLLGFLGTRTQGFAEKSVSQIG
jgi:hypothetical protein